MNKNLYFGCILIIFLSAACSSISVKTDYDPSVDFSSYKTYRWIDFDKMTDDHLSKNPLLRNRIISTVDEELKRKGFILSEEDEVDLVVVVHGSSEERMNVTNWTGVYRYDSWEGQYGDRVDVSYYEQGTLVIDVVDTKDDDLIWRGLGTSVIKDYADPESLQKAVNEYVSRVLKDFPPPKK